MRRKAGEELDSPQYGNAEGGQNWASCHRLDGRLVDRDLKESDRTFDPRQPSFPRRLPAPAHPNPQSAVPPGKEKQVDNALNLALIS